MKREPGDILHPDREGPLELAQAKKDLGSAGFAGQYEQSPQQLDGGIFKRSWWKYFNPLVMPRMDVIIQSWDFATKDKLSSDFVVGLVLGKRGADRYVLDCVRDRMDFPASCAALMALSMKWKTAHKKAIEGKANGPAVIAQLKSKITGLVEVEPIGDKMQRANACSPEVEAGNWHLPESAPWLSDFLFELGAFPRGKHDDTVDAFSQGAYVLRGTGIMPSPSSGHGSGKVFR
jgi:predicted phage terminase large subunit-like protein